MSVKSGNTRKTCGRNAWRELSARSPPLADAACLCRENRGVAEGRDVSQADGFESASTSPCEHAPRFPSLDFLLCSVWIRSPWHILAVAGREMPSDVKRVSGNSRKLPDTE